MIIKQTKFKKLFTSHVEIEMIPDFINQYYCTFINNIFCAFKTIKIYNIQSIFPLYPNLILSLMKCIPCMYNQVISAIFRITDQYQQLLIGQRGSVEDSNLASVMVRTAPPTAHHHHHPPFLQQLEINITCEHFIPQLRRVRGWCSGEEIQRDTQNVINCFQNIIKSSNINTENEPQQPQ